MMSLQERKERIRAVNAALKRETDQSTRVELVLWKLALFGYGAQEMKVEG